MAPALPPITARPVNPHHARIGGDEAVARLVDAFYRQMDTLPEAAGIRAMHEADLGPTREVLKKYLAEWLGGPARYSAERGHPRLRMRHAAFPIGAAERDAWLTCMQRAMDEVVTDAALREQLMHSFFKTADWIRNTPGNPHDSHP
jgi:hemoglobin